MAHRVPLVSLGVPVFNGESFLADALDSLLAQTCGDFELVIADNASTDATEAICRDYLAMDARIRYVRHDRNMGAPANWNFVARQARGEYFKWASANDVCAPTFLEECATALTSDPGVVLCYGRTCFIDEAGERQVPYEGDLGFEEARPSERFKRVCRDLAMNNAQSGVVRRDALLRTRLVRPYPSGDMVLTAELALLGRIRLLPSTLLYRRTGGSSMTSRMSAEALARVFDPAGKGTYRGTVIRRHLDTISTAFRAAPTWSERVPTALGALQDAAWSRAAIWRELRELIGVRTLIGS
jgi:glycosyltransferase involved in cell wall biosynthesis